MSNSKLVYDGRPRGLGRTLAKAAPTQPTPPDCHLHYPPERSKWEWTGQAWICLVCHPAPPAQGVTAESEGEA